VLGVFEEAQKMKKIGLKIISVLMILLVAAVVIMFLLIEIYRRKRPSSDRNELNAQS